MRLVFAVALGAVTLSACRPSSRPVTAPAPVAVTGDSIEARPAGSVRGAAGAVSRTDGGRRATEVVGAGLHEAESDAGPSGNAAEGPSWDIAVEPYETNDRVEFYVRRFTGPARSWVSERLGRGTRFEPMIRAKLRDGGLPEDLYYLAFVESGYDPNAYSRAAAVGIWQFMSSTARGMGLQLDWWVDERRDPVRSTDAAVRFLRGLNNQFGSLYLAAAAYNGGPARISRGLSRFADAVEAAEGEDRFFALSEQEYLPRETREYVPQIIAAALVGKDPARYELAIDSLEAFAYDSVQVAPLSSLPAIARAAGTTTATIKGLNPHFIRAVTPPGKKSVVRIPVGSRERFDSAFATLSEEAKVGVKTVRVAEAASLASVARKHGTTSDALRNFNPTMKRTQKGNVAAGQSLLVPDGDVAAAALTVPDPRLEGRDVRSIRYHVVKPGETLSHIALRNGTTVETIMRLNRMKKATIFPGQELVVTGTPRAK